MARSQSKAVDRIDELMERAEAALESTEYFEAELFASAALDKAHRAGDYDRMARIVMPLEEARRQKRLLAADAGVAGRLTEAPGDSWPDRAGCWLVEPPLVGADGRELRRIANENRVPVLLLTREPVTRLGAWPIVVIGYQTVRAYVEPPKTDRLDVSWFLAACEELGDAAIESVDVGRSVTGRVDDLVARIETLRDHDTLHQTLAAACRAALHAEGGTDAPPARRAG